MPVSTHPLVSVVIPVYNGQDYIEEAINSVLAQTYPNLEIIVVDDGSTDNTPHLLKKYTAQEKIILLSHQNRQNMGVSHSRKLAVTSAKGEYIAFLDADDIFLPQKITVQLEALKQDPEIVLCHSNIQPFSPTGHYPDVLNKHFNLAPAPYKYQFNQLPNVLSENPICNSTVIVRTDILNNLSFVSKQLFQVEDWLMWTLIGAKGYFLYLPQQLIRYRYHSASATNKFLSNPLAQDYANLEFYLSLLSRTEDAALRSLTIEALQSSLINLVNTYTESHFQNDRYFQSSILAEQMDLGSLNHSMQIKHIIIENLSANDIAGRIPVIKIIKALGVKTARKLGFGKV